MKSERHTKLKQNITETANAIQERQLIKQLSNARYSKDAIQEILHFYGVDSK